MPNPVLIALCICCSVFYFAKYSVHCLLKRERFCLFSFIYGTPFLCQTKSFFAVLCFCCRLVEVFCCHVFLLSSVLAVDCKSFFTFLCFCCPLEEFFCCLVQFKGTVSQDIVFWAQWKEKTYNISAEGFNNV